MISCATRFSSAFFTKIAERYCVPASGPCRFRVVGSWVVRKIRKISRSEMIFGSYVIWTGHAEAIRIRFDPKVVSYAELLEVFWRSHDPTTLDHQGYDVGTQYRSAIFTHSPRQAELAEKYKKKIDEAKVFSSPVVTTIQSAEEFYPAENYHQDFFEANGQNRYCRSIIAPKLDKLKAVFADRMK